MRKYTSVCAVVLGTLLTSRFSPLAWIADAHGRVMEQELLHAFGMDAAQPISCGLILRGPRACHCPDSTSENRGV